MGHSVTLPFFPQTHTHTISGSTLVSGSSTVNNIILLLSFPKGKHKTSPPTSETTPHHLFYPHLENEGLLRPAAVRPAHISSTTLIYEQYNKTDPVTHASAALCLCGQVHL